MGVLLEALEILLKKNENLKIHFEFCGTGPLESKLNELVEKYPKFIQNNGYVPNNEIHEYYLKSDVYLFTSRREPFPRSIMEALGAGLIIDHVVNNFSFDVELQMFKSLIDKITLNG